MEELGLCWLKVVVEARDTSTRGGGCDVMLCRSTGNWF